MPDLNQILFYAQIAVSITLIILIAVQQRGAALGGAFGGSGEFYTSRRGIQKNIYYATIVAAALFILLGVANLFV